MDSNPLISVILPFSGESVWLREAIASIRNQSLREWELLLIANEAGPNAMAIANEHATHDTRIRIITTHRKGIAPALNLGIEKANAHYIARMDDDDIAHPDRLQRQYQRLKDSVMPTALSCRVDAVPGYEPLRGMQEYMSWQNGLTDADAHYLNRFIDAPIVHPTLFCRRDLFSQYGFYSSGEVPEDYELWLRWMEAGVRFEKVPENLLAWRDHGMRLSRTHAHYDKATFQAVRMKYLHRWLEQALQGRKLIFCGTSRASRKRAAALSEYGISIHAFTDVIQQSQNVPFIPAADINPSSGHFYLSLLPRRASNSLRDFLYKRGLSEGRDFLLAG